MTPHRPAASDQRRGGNRGARSTAGARFREYDPALSAGVPLLMPGERITQQSRAVLDFLLMLCSIGQHYPGFETDIHGAKRNEDGVYRTSLKTRLLACLTGM